MWKKNVIHKLCLLALAAAGMVESLHAVPYHQTVGAVEGSSPTSVVLRDDGTVWVSGFMWNAIDGVPWGGGALRTTVPVQVANVNEIKSIAIESQGVFGLTDSGDLYAWGDGNFGSGSFQSFQTPSLRMTGISSIQTSNGAIFAIDSADGSVWAWGKHGGYNLGIGGSLSTVYTPTKIPNLTNIVSIAAHGKGGAAVDSSGQLWSWGLEALGHSGAGPQAYPALVPGVTNAKEVAASQGVFKGTMIVLLNEQGGIVKAWGEGSNGQLGAGESAPASTGTMIQSGVYQTASGPAYLTGVASVAGGPGGFFALLSDGTVWGWGGTNAWRAAGKEAPFEAPYPDSVVKYCHQVSGAANVTEISTCANLLIMRTADGYVLTSTASNDGAAGDGISHTRATPVQVHGLRYIDSISTGLESAYALSGGKVYSWGRHTGDGTGSPSQLPVLAKTSASQPLTGVVQIAGGSSHTLARTSNGHVYVWGLGSYGNLGLGTSVTSALYAKPISGLTTAQDISAGDVTSFAVILNANNIRVGRSWGDGSQGALASGTRATRYTPAAVYSASGTVLQGIKKISAGGSHALFLMNNGAVRGSGSASPAVGEIYTAADKLYARPVPNLTGVNDISAGSDHSLAIASGKVYSWGRNYMFSLGLGHSQEAPGVHEVPGFPSFTSAWVPVLAAVRYGGGLVEHSSGTIKGFGGNGSGQLADGTFDDRPLASPTLLTDYKQISANGPIIGLKHDGTVWTWGSVTAGVVNPLLRQMALNLSNDPADADFDGTPDAWEVQYFGSITAYDGADDADGDGLSNVQEFLMGTAPNEADQDGDGFNDIADPFPADPFNGDMPALVQVKSGNNQRISANNASVKMEVLVKRADDTVMADVPVTWSVTSGDAKLTPQGEGVDSFTVKTDSNGVASMTWTSSFTDSDVVIQATSGTVSATFNHQVSGVALGGLVSRFRADAGIATMSENTPIAEWQSLPLLPPVTLAAQTEVDKQPRWITSQVDGKPAVLCDGNDSLNLSGDTFNFTSYHFFVVARAEENGNFINLGNAAPIRFGVTSGNGASALSVFNADRYYLTPEPSVDNRFHIYEVACWTTSSSSYRTIRISRDGVLLHEATITAPNSWTRSESKILDLFKGEIREVLIYRSRLTDSARNENLEFLAGKWLPAGATTFVSAGYDFAAAFDNTGTVTRTLKGIASVSTLPGSSPDVSVQWEKVSGPGNVSFDDSSNPEANATFTSPGTYVLRLSVVGDPSISDEVKIRIFPAYFTLVIDGSGSLDSIRPYVQQTAELLKAKLRDEVFGGDQALADARVSINETYGDERWLRWFRLEGSNDEVVLVFANETSPYGHLSTPYASYSADYQYTVPQLATWTNFRGKVYGYEDPMYPGFGQHLTYAFNAEHGYAQYPLPDSLSYEINVPVNRTAQSYYDDIMTLVFGSEL